MMKTANLLDIKDIKIKVNDSAVGGVFDFDITVDGKQTQVYEILSDKPWALISAEKKYVITLKQYSNVFVYFGDNFVLELTSKNQNIIFSDCTAKSIRTTVNESGKLVTTTEIIAGGAELNDKY